MNKSNLFIVFLFTSFSMFAQLEKTSELYKTILGLDTELFDAYNTCTDNLEKHASFYADEIDDKWRSYKNGLYAESDHYGSEIDLMAKWKLNPRWKFRTGASVFLPGDAIKEAVASEQEFLTDDTAYSAIFQITYTFTQRI